MSNVKEEMQMAGFQIIATVGMAKSSYMEALELAREGHIEEAQAKVAEGREMFSEAHHHHLGLLQKEAQGEDLPFSLILMHAEDQLLTTESIELMISEMIIMYSKINK